MTKYQAERIEAGTVHGMNLGSYRILEKIGAGGMGVVFRAEHIHLRRMAAIKMLPLYASANVDGPLLTRFFDEIRIIARLNHPNIVGAIDTGEISGEGCLMRLPRVTITSWNMCPARISKTWCKPTAPFPSCAPAT